MNLLHRLFVSVYEEYKRYMLFVKKQVTAQTCPLQNRLFYDRRSGRKEGKMKKRQLGLGIAAVLSAVMVFAGCGTEKQEDPVALREVVEKMKENEMKSAAAAMNMEFKGGYSMTGVSQEFSMTMGLDMKWISDPMAAYMNETIQTSGGDEAAEKVQVEMYLVSEEDKSVLYFSSDDQWYQISGGSLDEYKEFTIIPEEAGFDTDSFTEEQLNTVCKNANASVDGRPAYEFVLNADFSDMSSLAEEALQGLSSVLGSSFLETEAVITLYIDKETFYPISYFIELGKAEQGSDESGSSDAAQNNAQNANGVWIDKCTISIKYADINEVDAITVPDEVKANALDFNAMFSK